MANAPLEKYVRDALNKAGHRVDELDDTQRERAVSAPTTKAGLRGKSLAAYVMDGNGLATQARDAQTQRDLKAAEDKRTKRSAAAKANGAAKNLKGNAAAPLSAADKAAARAASAGSKPKAASKPKSDKPKAAPVPRSAKYPDNIRAAVEAAKRIGGRNWWPSPIDHVEARNVVTKLLADQGQAPSRANIKALSGTDEAALTAMANMSAGREQLKVLKDLNSHMGDASAKGRNLAAILLMWMDELDGKLNVPQPTPPADPMPEPTGDPEPTPPPAADVGPTDADVADPDPDDVTVVDADPVPAGDPVNVADAMVEDDTPAGQTD
jgi:hypothetical protein